jgi:hypothetical protein
MVIYVNNKNEIKDVGSTNNPNLIPLTILDEDNPFDGWSIAKICCFKAEVENGIVTMFTPYISAIIIDQLDRLGKENEVLKKENASTQAQLDYVTMMTDVEV